VERAGIEVDGDGLAWGYGVVKCVGHRDFIGLVTRAPGSDLKIVGGGAAVVGTFGEYLRTTHRDMHIRLNKAK
jgi:hypothetical protein